MTETYIVRREHGTVAERWVARNENGDWRAYCKLGDAATAAESARMMFHADEVVVVVDFGWFAVVTVRVY